VRCRLTSSQRAWSSAPHFRAELLRPFADHHFPALGQHIAGRDPRRWRLEVRGFGRQKGHSDIYRGTEYTLDFLPKVKFEIVVPDDRVQEAIQAILQAARTGKIGDGKVFVVVIEEAVQIRLVV
jgi:nitrogen regulatory protein PII